MRRTRIILALTAVACLSLATFAAAATGPAIKGPHAKLCDATPQLGVMVGDLFGSGVCSVGDINNDGVDDLAVGAEGTGGSGAVWILLMNADATVLQATKVDASSGVMAGFLSADDEFGTSVCAIGDVDNNGAPDIAVGAANDDVVDVNNDQIDDGGGINRGAVYILFMNTNGTVRKAQKIDDTDPLLLIPNNSDQFGDAVTSLGDLDGAGGTELALAVGAPGDRVDGFLKGAVWILFMDYDGTGDAMTVVSTQKISDSVGTPASFVLTNSVTFGTSLSTLPDLNADGRRELVVGSSLDDDNDGAVVGLSINRGAVWIMQMNADGTAATADKISDTAGSFTGTLDDSDFFGDSVQGLEDLNNDGVPDLVVGAGGDDDGGSARGAAYLLFLNTAGGSVTVSDFCKTSDTEGEFNVNLDNDDMFGNSLGATDLNGDGAPEILIGAMGDDDGGGSAGAVYVGTIAAPPVAICQDVDVLADSTGCIWSMAMPSDVDNGSFDPQGLPITLTLEPPGPYGMGANPVQLIVTSTSGCADTCDAIINVNCPVPVTLTGLAASRNGDDATVVWEVTDAVNHLGFHVYREESGERVKINDQLLSGQESYAFIDADAPRNQVDYWVAEVSRSGQLAWHGPVTLASASPTPVALTMAPAQPNPFAASTRIAYALPEAGTVSLTVYDISGRQVATLLNIVQGPGEYTVTWDGRTDRGDQASVGLYFLKLKVGNESRIQKAVLAR